MSAMPLAAQGGCDSRAAPEPMLDVSFRLNGGSLPVDHARALNAAITRCLPWFPGEPRAGVHLIRVAASGNGWLRPEPAAGELLQLSRRTRLTLRVPERRLRDTAALSGQALDIDGHIIETGESKVRRLVPSATLAAHYVTSGFAQDEADFVHWLTAELAKLGVAAPKVLCGRSDTITGPAGPLDTRGVLVAELAPEASLRVQARGLGEARKLGCGLFVPCRDIGPVWE